MISYAVYFRQAGEWTFRFYARGKSPTDLKRRIYFARQRTVSPVNLADLRVDELPDGHPLKKTP